MVLLSWPTYAEKAQKLIVNDKVAAVFGCWTSASKKGRSLFLSNITTCCFTQHFMKV